MAAQLIGLVHGGDSIAEDPLIRLQKSGNLPRSMPVGVCLYDSHHPAVRPHAIEHGVHVGPHGIQINIHPNSLVIHRKPLYQTAAIAPPSLVIWGKASNISPAIMAPFPFLAAARSPAIPWMKTAYAATSSGFFF